MDNVLSSKTKGWKMKLSIVVSTQPAQFQAATFKGDLEVNLRTLASLGYDGVELAIRDPKLINLDQLESLTQACGLSIPAIGTGQAWGEEGLSFTDPNDKIRQSAIERIKEHIPVASRFGAVIIIGLMRGIIKPGVEPIRAIDWLVEALRACATAAHPYGIRLALEPINRYETTLINNVAEGLELIECVGVGNLGLLLDTFHMNIEEPNLEQSIRSCGRHLFHFHVADSNRWYPGAGHLDFRSILTTLDTTGYTGWISGEFFPKPDALIAAEKNIRFLKNNLGNN
jgi:sugar phosphate isomerase/epimerase